MERPNRSPLAPRLVLIVAVLACVFGWGEAIAVAASGPEDSSHSQAAPASPAGLPGGHGEGSTGSVAPLLAPATEVAHAEHGDSGHGKAGHNASHEHAVSSCMVSSATSAAGALVTPDVAAVLVVAVVPPQARVRHVAGTAPEQRAPSIATLCVQRI